MDYCVEGDDGVEVVLLGDFLGYQWDFEGIWGVDDGDFVFSYVVVDQGVDGVVDQVFYDEVVEVVDYQGVVVFGGNEGIFDGFQGYEQVLFVKELGCCCVLSEKG